MKLILLGSFFKLQRLKLKKVGNLGTLPADSRFPISSSVKFRMYLLYIGASQVVLVVKNTPGNAGNVRDSGSIPGSGRSPGGGHGNRLQCSCLENPMDRGVWRATVHVAVVQSLSCV